MKRMLSIVTILLLVVLAGGIYWYTAYEKDQATASQWLPRPLDAVASIHVMAKSGSYILSANGESWEAQVPGASWNISVHPKVGRIKGYISLLSDLEPLRYVGDIDAVGAEKLGLEEPGLKLIVAFQGNGQKPLTLKFSADKAGKMYGWNSDTPAKVYEFEGAAFQNLHLPAVHFLDDSIFRITEETVDRVQLVQPFGSSWQVEKSNGEFVFQLPGYLKKQKASTSELKLYIHALALLKAGKLILEPVVVEKTMPALTIRAWTKGEAEPGSVDFYVVEDDSEVYLGRSSWLTVPFLLDAQSVAQLVRSAFDVQDRTVVHLDIGSVDSIVIDHGTRVYHVVRTDNGWRVRGGENGVPGIDMSLWRFTELEFEALPLNNLSETAVKLMQCRLRDVNGTVLKEMTFYADPQLPKGQCWMKNGGGMYYPVSSRLLKDLQGMFPAGSSGQNG